MDLVVTVDVEEDQWGPFTTGRPSVGNVEEIPRLQQLFDQYGVIPTYLLTYPVARDESAAGLFRDLLDAGRCEIGMHCHPWNTPPCDEAITARNSMLCNLPAALQLEKVQRLHDLLCRRFGRPPSAFRSGRWGFSRTTADVLARVGCLVDTSITPYTSWIASEGPDFSSYSPHTFMFPAPSAPTTSPSHESSDTVLELPVTIGYVGGSFASCHRLKTHLTRRPFHRLRLVGILAKLELIRSVWLSPERESPARLIRLLHQAEREACRTLNLFFHSSSLRPGCTPFVRNAGDKARLFHSLAIFFQHCQKSGVLSAPLSRVTQHIRSSSARH